MNEQEQAPFHGVSETSITLQQLLDERDVQRLVLSYMSVVDRRQYDLLPQYFTEEIFLDYTDLRPDPPAETRAVSSVVEEWAARMGPLPGYQHHIGNVVPSIDGENATCSASGIATHLRDNNGQPVLWQLGAYYDLGLIRMNVGWRINSVKVTKNWDWTTLGS